MSSTTESPRSNVPPELPPVEPPTAGFIVQLFVIPAVIVFVVIVVWLLFGKLAGGERGALDYVQILRSPNANYRAAYELANLIQNDSKLAADPVLLGELTDLLEQDLKSPDIDPKLLQFLTLSLGSFSTTEGKTVQNRPIDPLEVLARALGDKSSEDIRIAAATSIAKLASKVGKPVESKDATAALANASKSPEVSLRKIAVYALGFLGGDEPVVALKAALGDSDRDVRYNAAAALGRRGVKESVPLLKDMLSQAALDQTIKAENDSEKTAIIETIQLQALHSIRTAVSGGNKDLLTALRPEVEALTKSGLVKVRNDAEELLKK